MNQPSANVPGPSTNTWPEQLVTLCVFIGAAGLWELMVRWFQVPQWILPSPHAILAEMYVSAGYLWQHSLVTFREILVGFGLALLLGILLGIAIAFFPLLERTLYKLLVATQSVPKVAVAPILVIWLGLGDMSKIAMAFLLCFFPIVVGTVSGLQSTNRELLDLAEVLGASWLQAFLKIRFPAALPYLFSGLRVSIGVAATGAVIGEFVNADRGLGYSLLMASSQLKGPLTFSVVIILAGVGIALFSLVAWLERVACPWARTMVKGDIM